MKTAKCLFPLLLFILAITGLGCGGDKSAIKAVITNELNLLKKPDSDTVQKYISYTELFPDTVPHTELSEEINEVFSLFFRDFNYKILDINVDQESGTASAGVRLFTLDGKELAKDFAAAQLEKDIIAAADTNSQDIRDTYASSQDDFSQESSSEYSVSPAASSAADSLQERYLTLGELLKEKKYETVERNCIMELHHPEDNENSWEIIRTESLENDLVGGLMAFLSNSDILTPEETLNVYLNTLKSMNEDQMSNYLGIETIVRNSDPSKSTIASALADQVRALFDFKIMDSDINGYSAVIETEITTFDSDAILSSYQDNLDKYLSTPAAVIDGAQKRYQYCHDVLLDCIESNQETTTLKEDFTLVNDGSGWKPVNLGQNLGQALFGTLAVSPLEDPGI